MRNLRASACKPWRTLSGERSGSSRLQGRIASLHNASAGHLALTWNFAFITCLLDRKTSLVPLKRTYVLPCVEHLAFKILERFNTYPPLWSTTRGVNGRISRESTRVDVKKFAVCKMNIFWELELLGIPQAMKKNGKEYEFCTFVGSVTPLWYSEASILSLDRKTWNITIPFIFRLQRISVIKCV